MKNRILVLGLLVGTTIFRLHAQDDEAPVTLNALFTGDAVKNFKGGIKRGNTALGLVNMMLTLNTESAGLWKGGVFFLNSQTLLGGQPSNDFIGDIQMASNIEGMTNRYIYEAWYRQEWNYISLLLGIHNLNSDFFVCSNGLLYLNSSFGTGAFLSLNHYVSIYPVTTLGAVFRYDKERFSFLTGIYNHGRDFAEEESFHFKNHLFKQGYMALAEVQFRPTNWNGEYKFGTTIRKCVQSSLLSEPLFIKENNLGFYFIGDQQLLNYRNRTFSTFTQFGYNTSESNVVPVFLSGGINVKGLFSGNEKEEIGVAFIHTNINELIENKYVYSGYESLVEITGRYKVSAKFSIHPDFQYILNPSGNNELQNALVGIMRLEMNF